MPLLQSHSRSNLPILFLGDGRIEWVSGDPDKRYSCNGRRADSNSPRELAEQALELVELVDEKPCRCLVMVGGTLTSQRMLTLAPMPAKDLRGVLERKAANLLGVEPRDAWYRAIQLAGAENAEEQRWLICAIRRSELLALTHELERVGFRPQGISVPRLSLLSAHPAGQQDSEAELTRILLCLEPGGVAISLTSKGELVQQTFVPGLFEQQSGLASSVLQELRSFEGFWRKLSRGGSIDEVLLFGLTEDTSLALTPAIRTALGNRDCKVVMGPLCESENEARAFALKMAAAASDSRGDLTPKEPPSKSLILAAAMCAATFGMILGFYGQGHLSQRRQVAESYASELSAGARDYSRLQRQLSASAEVHEAALLRAERLKAVGSSGHPLQPLMADIEAAFRGRALLQSVKLQPGDMEAEIELLGSTDPDPALSLRMLNELVSELEQSGTCSDVVLLPPNGRLSEDAESELRFQVRSSLEGKQ